MTNNTLVCHPDKLCTATESLSAGFGWLPEGHLKLCYELTGDLTQLRIPAPQSPDETDGLWEYTCFEAFIAVEGEAGYHEFNFSPSGQWAAYAFSDYRVRSIRTTWQPPFISLANTNKHLLLEAVISAADLPQNIAGKPFQLGLTAVIEATDGSRSYWALRHPVTRPDFHHRAGFILSIKQQLRNVHEIT